MEAGWPVNPHVAALLVTLHCIRSWQAIGCQMKSLIWARREGIVLFLSVLFLFWTSRGKVQHDNTCGLPKCVYLSVLITEQPPDGGVAVDFRPIHRSAWMTPTFTSLNQTRDRLSTWAKCGSNENLWLWNETDRVLKIAWPCSEIFSVCVCVCGALPGQWPWILSQRINCENPCVVGDLLSETGGILQNPDQVLEIFFFFFFWCCYLWTAVLIS